MSRNASRTPRMTLSAVDIAYEFRLNPDRVRVICAKLEPGRKVGHQKFYHLRPFLEAYVEAQLDKQGRSTSTVINAKRRTEIARAEKTELDNARVKGVLTPVKEVEAANSELLSILARGLEGISMRVKKRYPDIPPKYLSAVEDAVAKLRNDAIDDIHDLADDEEIENERRFAERALAREEMEALAEIEEKQRKEDDRKRSKEVPAPTGVQGSTPEYVW